jgi:hypothetical protein
MNVSLTPQLEQFVNTKDPHRNNMVIFGCVVGRIPWSAADALVGVCGLDEKPTGGVGLRTRGSAPPFARDATTLLARLFVKHCVYSRSTTGFALNGWRSSESPWMNASPHSTGVF